MYIIKFMGGLGNQLFQFALLKKIQDIYPNAEYAINLDDFKNGYHNGFELSQQTKGLKRVSARKFRDFDVVTETGFDDANFSHNLVFDGYWQDYRFLSDVGTISPTLFSSMHLFPENNVALKMIENSESVSVHVRRGDYVKNSLHGNIANKTYFLNAIEHISSRIANPVFFVFSDDVNWCRNNLSFQGKNTHFINWNVGRDARYDLFLMSKCKHNIISNSSFSWWAQHMNINPDKMVIQPPYWYNEPRSSPELKVKDYAVTIQNIPLGMKRQETPFFSILVPVYNVASYLKRCLVSVCNQTFTNIELICVDDGSTDESSDILRDYALMDGRIVSITHGNNRSLRMSRASGIKKARGEYILFLDGDDWLELGACETLYQKLCIERVDILEYAYLTQPQGNVIAPPPSNPEHRLADLMAPRDSYPQTLWNKAYRGDMLRAAFQEMDDFYATMAEDAYHSAVIAFYAKTYAVIDQPLYNYGTQSGISSGRRRTLSDITRIGESMREVISHTRLFFERHDPKLLGLCKGLESHLADSMITGYILSDTIDEDIEAALFSSIKYFDQDLLAPYLRDLRRKADAFDGIQHRAAKARFHRLCERLTKKSRRLVSCLLSPIKHRKSREYK